MKNKIIDYIHIGDYKTGTTWLQNYIFPYHPEIEYLGDPFENKELEMLIYRLHSERDLDFDSLKISKTMEEYIRPIQKKNKITVISREALSATNYITGENAKRNAERIKQVFGDVKVIYVIREQISMLGSIYSQYIKMGGTLNIREFIFDKYESMGLIERLKYSKNIKAYEEIFGRENLFIGLYEEFKTDKDGFLKKLFNFMGCSDLNISGITDKKVNKSLTNIGVGISIFCNRFIRNYRHNHASKLIRIDKMIELILSKSKRKRLLQKINQTSLYTYKNCDDYNRLLFLINSAITYKIRKFAEFFTIGKPIRIPHNLQNTIKKHCCKDNYELLKKYKLPINKYGWHIEQ